MGGFGSGRYGSNSSEVRRRSVDEVCYIDIQTLKGSLDGETLKGSWDNGKYAIDITTHTDYIVFSYTADNKQLDSRIEVVKTTVGYGKRSWFKCPGCSKRKGRLYFTSNLFKCRDCHQLTYLTCQASGDPLRYLSLKIRHLQKQLGLEDGCDIHDTPIFKPKKMHWNTFSRLMEKLEMLQMQRMEEWLKLYKN